MPPAASTAAGTSLPVASPGGPGFLVSSAPHIAQGASTQRVMFTVAAALLPLWGLSIWLYRGQAVTLTLTVVAACLLTEALANKVRGRSVASVWDGSALVTGLILAFSLPPFLPLYMAFIGGVIAILLAKVVFGGLGQNLFNPAMVGRAFLMVCFPAAMGVWTEPLTLNTVGDPNVQGVTMATPLQAAIEPQVEAPPLTPLFTGQVSGSLGESSALLALVGGLFLIFTRVADWRQPLALLVTAAVGAFAYYLAWPAAVDPGVLPAVGETSRLTSAAYGMAFQLVGGSLIFGAFFIATDYVGAPLNPKGRLIFGAGCGLLIIVIRFFGAYPEGVMFAILIMNAFTPLIERWTTPTPFGGHVAT